MSSVRYKNMPGTDLNASVLSLGGGPLGTRLDEATSFRLMDVYADRGGNLIDTAEVYGNWVKDGTPSISEITIGRWMQSRNRRHQMIVSTKGGHPRLDAMQIPRLSPEDIITDVEGSLRRLQVETIDLYLLHRDDPMRPVAQIMHTMHQLVQSGKIRYVGCSNWTVERIQAARDVAKQQGWHGFVANQPMWSIADVDRAQFKDPTLVAMDEAMMSDHEQHQWTVMPYSSQAKGLFDKWAKGTHSFDDERLPACFRTEQNRLRFERIAQLARTLSLSVNQIVLGYLLSQPFPVVPIVGSVTELQLEDCFQAVDVTLTREQLNYLIEG
jgi:aryl-alcohol dehydrogenase-like predicted oxidoreductase